MSLPIGYKQLEYIQSSGTQWIDTGFKPNQNTKVEMKVSTTEGTSSSVPYLFGAQDSNNYFVATWVLGFGYGLVTSGIDLYDGVAHDVKVENGVLYKDGTAIAHGQASTFNISVSIGLFAVHSTRVSDVFGVCKVYSCKIYDNGVLVRDFIPCKNASGVVGMWDDVNSQFYNNAGTGTFIAGPIVVSQSEIIKLEYIESTGTQYIDTGFIPNQDTRIDMVAYPTSVVDAGGGVGFVPYGSAQAYNSRAFECYTTSAQYEFNYGTTYKSIGNAAIGQKVAITHNKNNVSLSINDGPLLTTSFIYSSFTTPYTMTLFGTHRSSILCGQQKIYSCQIRDNGHLIRNFIPCKNTNGVVGLWDDVGQLFYENNGSGTFIAGPEIHEGGIFVKVNGVWKQIDNITVNVN